MRISGLQLFTPRIFRDERGFFLETFRSADSSELFMQDNLSFSRKGTIRGLHFQLHPGQAKRVMCLQGTIWDVAVDIRPDSPTYSQWEAVELDGTALQQFYIPIGFAHGFCTLSETALVHYKVSAPYCPAMERSIRWNDPTLAIAWPIQDPILSERDQISPLFEEVFA